ncbi:hypothetical protein GmHk_05G013007 [Glycine max]|nr:hypothetical protein GmHk_05G013007 [Glycine max]
MDVLELDHPSLDNPFIPIDFDESQRYKSMIIYDIHNFSTKKLNRERKDKEKSSIICYECKNPGHFKLKCPNLDKSNDKKIYFKPKDKKLLMIIWEDLDDSSSN